MLTQKHLILIILSFVLYSGCGTEDDATTSTTSTSVNNIDANSLILTLPTSVSETSTSPSNILEMNQQSVARSNEEHSPSEIYQGIRKSIGGLEMFSTMIKSLSGEILKEGNNLQLKLSVITEASPFIYESTNSEDGGPAGVKVTKNASGSTYDFTAILYWQNSAKQYVPGISFSFSPTSVSEGKGEVYIDMSAVGNDGGGGPSVGVAHVTFNTADATLGKTMSMEIAGMTDSSGGPTNGTVTASLKNDIMTISGNLYFPKFGDSDGDGSSDNPLFGSEPSNYIFVGQVNNTTNNAVVSLALPPATNTDTTSQLFDDFSVGTIFQSGFVNNFIGAIQTGPGCCCTLGTVLGLSDANVCTTATPTCGGGCSARTQSIDTITTAYDTFCLGNTSDGICSQAGYVFNMVNPAYFDKNGFVGTEAYNTPTTGYEGLSTDNITFKSAKAVSEMSLVFDRTPVTSVD
jgi:hypothetical protein